jgi:hypothetical protein
MVGVRMGVLAVCVIKNRKMVEEKELKPGFVVYIFMVAAVGDLTILMTFQIMWVHKCEHLLGFGAIKINAIFGLSEEFSHY